MPIMVLNHVTLDGVMQSPGRADEDTRGGFQYGGWASAVGGLGSLAVATLDVQPSGASQLLAEWRRAESSTWSPPMSLSL